MVQDKHLRYVGQLLITLRNARLHSHTFQRDNRSSILGQAFLLGFAQVFQTPHLLNNPKIPPFASKYMNTIIHVITPKIIQKKLTIKNKYYF